MSDGDDDPLSAIPIAEQNAAPSPAPQATGQLTSGQPSGSLTWAVPPVLPRAGDSNPGPATMDLTPRPVLPMGGGGSLATPADAQRAAVTNALLANPMGPPMPAPRATGQLAQGQPSGSLAWAVPPALPRAGSATAPVMSPAGGPIAHAADGTPVWTDANGNAVATPPAAPGQVNNGNSFATLPNGQTAIVNSGGAPIPGQTFGGAMTPATVAADNTAGAASIAARAQPTASDDPGGYIYNGLVRRGFPPVQAAALAGNMQQESTFKPNAFNKNEGAVGLLQWRGPRAAALNTFAAGQGKPPTDIDTQLDFVKHEMQTTEAKSSTDFQKATTLQDANHGLHAYIRYGDNTEPTRLANAQGFVGAGAPAAQTAQTASAAPAADPDAPLRAEPISATPESAPAPTQPNAPTAAAQPLTAMRPLEVAQSAPMQSGVGTPLGNPLADPANTQLLQAAQRPQPQAQPQPVRVSALQGAMPSAVPNLQHATGQEDPRSGPIANAFGGGMQQVMSGRALLAKYLPARKA